MRTNGAPVLEFQKSVSASSSYVHPSAFIPELIGLYRSNAGLQSLSPLIHRVMDHYRMLCDKDTVDFHHLTDYILLTAHWVSPSMDQEITHKLQFWTQMIMRDNKDSNFTLQTLAELTLYNLASIADMKIGKAGSSPVSDWFEGVTNCSIDNKVLQ